MKSYQQLFAIAQKPLSIKINIAEVISKQQAFPINIIRKGIKQGQLKINGKPVYLSEIVLKSQTIIKFQNVIVDIESCKRDNLFDKYIDLVLQEINEFSLELLKSSSKKNFCCYLIDFFENNSVVEVSDSESLYFNDSILELECLYKECFKDSKTPKRKELLDNLLRLRDDAHSELSKITTNLNDGIFSNSFYKFLQEYTRILNKDGFQLLLAPQITSSLYSRNAIDALIQPITEAKTLNDIEGKFLHFDNNKNIYNAYLGLIDNSIELHSRIFNNIGTYFFDVFKAACDTADIKPAAIQIVPTARKYNFYNQERTEYDLFLNIRNDGKGLGRDIVISSQSELFIFDPFTVGILKPGDSREVSINTYIRGKVHQPILKIKCNWLDLTGTVQEKILTITFGVQNSFVPWTELEKSKPYTIQEIEDKEKLYGRDEILRELEQNILSNIIESYKIWGQKRVGKSSIVKTLRSLFNNKEKVIVVWRSIAGLKNIDPIQTLNTLGESICSEMFEEIDVKITNRGVKQSLRSISVPEFNGSLSPLEIYIKKLKGIESELRFIFIIDEFDRINEEFFLPGILGDSFSLNIGKGLNSLNYVGFILVGSENMHLLDRQEMNYNNFQNREVDTFDKEKQFTSFKNIVISPVSPYINYTDEAVEKIYDATNGNPYFANLICSNVFNICLNLKDNEVDLTTVLKAISSIANSYQKSHFEHFWADGVTEESTAKKDKKTDVRRRLLVSYSFCFFQNKTFPSKVELVKNFRKPLEYEVEIYEIDNTIVEFYNRKIFFDQNKVIRIKPSIFEMWLCGPGRTLMIEGVSDLEALQREKQLEAEHILKPEELQRISDQLIFQGDKLKVSELASYFNQFGSPFEQRRIYNLFDKIYYISKDQIINFIKSEQKNIFRKNELNIKSQIKSPYREDVETYSFAETINENNSIFETFKLFSLIRKNKALRSLVANKDAYKNNGADDIIILESIIVDFFAIQADLMSFLDEKLVASQIPVKLISLVITSKAKADLIKATSSISNFKFIHFKEIEESKIKPFVETTEVFETLEEAGYAFGEIRKHYHGTSKECINVLFETHCPAKSIPIYWNSNNQFNSPFPNPFGKIYKDEIQDNGEINRDRIYQANKKFIQTINPFLINYIKEKAKKEGKDDWFMAEYIPGKVMERISLKWIEDGTSKPKESYLDVIHYKEIIKKNKELLPVFQMTEGGGDGLNWIDKLNELRRDPAHPEKPAPSTPQAEYFERKTDEVIKQIKLFKEQNKLT